jgi:hypothetical protein
MKKRTQVTIRTRQRVLVPAVRVRCQQCGAEVPIISAENAAELMAASEADVHQLLTRGELHAVDESPGITLICANSVSAVSTEDENQNGIDQGAKK